MKMIEQELLEGQGFSSGESEKQESDDSQLDEAAYAEAIKIMELQQLEGDIKSLIGTKID